MNWLYYVDEIVNLSQVPEGTYGFIYKVTHTPSGKIYIGKKVLYHNQKKKLTKAELELSTGRGRKSLYKIVQKESDWKTYYGSQKDIKEYITQGKKEEFKREIIQFVNNKKLLTYFETKWLFINGVLEYPDAFYNDNILGKFYRKDFDTQE
jgi:serine/threonine protein kinase